jgi:MarR family transcriptional regulator, 2-MHQ and catechol-resistance regulon repressor
MANAPHIRLVLWKTAKAVEKVDKTSIYATGLHLSDFQILEILLHKGPQPINVIGEKMLLTSGSMTAAAKRLEKKGLVKRIQNPLDGRCFNVHLTAGGKAVIEKAFAVHEKNLEKVVSVLTSAERNELVRLLKKIGYNADRLNQES